MNKGGTPENLKPFEPGESGNPNGRPKGARSLSSVLKEMLEQKIDVLEGDGKKTKKQFKEVILRRLLKAASDGDVRAINAIFDRVDGKAQQFIEMTVPGGIHSDNKHVVEFYDMSQPKREPAKAKRKKK